MASTRPPTCQHLALSDNRLLSFAEYGVPAGKPVLFIHGFPGSRLEAAIWADAACALGIRLIAPDRPGTGLSSFQTGRYILDWPRDLLALADHLGILQLRMPGTCGGCPYVLSCTKEIPRSRLLGAEIVSGMLPLSLGTKE